MSIGDASLASEFPGRPRSATAGCYFCNTHRLDGDAGVIDTGHHVHMEGFVYICLTCVDHLANVSGGADRAEAVKLRAKIVALGDSNRRLGAEARAQKSLADTYEQMWRDKK